MLRITSNVFQLLPWTEASLTLTERTTCTNSWNGNRKRTTLRWTVAQTDICTETICLMNALQVSMLLRGPDPGPGRLVPCQQPSRQSASRELCLLFVRWFCFTVRSDCLHSKYWVLDSHVGALWQHFPWNIHDSIRFDSWYSSMLRFRVNSQFLFLK